MAWTPGLPAGVQAVLVTHESREDVRRETLDHLEKQGVEPHVHIHKQGGEAKHVRQAAIRALEAVEWGRGVLFLEDDIRLRPDWRRVMDLVVAVDVPTVCCSLELGSIPRPWCDLIRDDPKAARTVEPRVVPMSPSGVFYGVQFVYLPTWFLKVLWDSPVAFDQTEQRKGMAFDGLLNHLTRAKPGGTSMALTIPDMAQHLSPPSVRSPNRHKRQAHMFHWRLS